MIFDFAEIPGPECYKLLTATVTPRPIAWVVSLDAAGGLNAAPYSFFNVFSGDPAIVAVGVGSHSPTRRKDTVGNVRATGQFVVSLVSETLARRMNVTAIEFDAGIDELKEARVDVAASARVAPPRIADSPVSLECEVFQIVDLNPQNTLLIGKVLAMHVHDEFVLDPVRHHIDTRRLGLIGRMHGRGWYARTTDLFQLERIPVADWPGAEAYWAENETR